MDGPLSDLLVQTEAWLKKIDDAQAMERFNLAKTDSAASAFRIAIVGGVSRGKTHLLNELLDTDIFPEGSTPTTTVLTEIKYGKDKKAVFVSGAGSTTVSLTREALAEFSAEETFGDKAGMLEITWPADFLKSDLVLYDTPGIDDVFTNRANISYDAIASADAALVVIAANTPLSLLESGFIETYLARRAIPHIAIVVAFLDIIPKEQQARQIEFIRKKAASISSSLEVWCSQDTSYSDCQIGGSEAIRTELDKWAKDPARKYFRQRQLLEDCISLAKSALSRLALSLGTLEKDKQGGRQALFAAYEALDSKKEAWQAMRAGFMEKGKATAHELDERLNELQAAIQDSYSKDPDEQFRLELRPRLSHGGQMLSDLLRERLAHDTDELQAKLAQEFGVTVSYEDSIQKSFSLGLVFPDLPEQNAGDILVVLVNFARSLWKEMAPMLPIPVIFRGKAQEWVDNGLNSLAGFFGCALGNKVEIEALIGDFFATLRQQIKASVFSLYSETADHLKNEQERWYKNQREMLAAIYTPADLTQKIQAIHEQIETGERLEAMLSKASQSLAATSGE